MPRRICPATHSDGCQESCFHIGVGRLWTRSNSRPEKFRPIIWRTAVTTRQKPSVSATKKRQATKTDASVIAQPASPTVNPGLALARIAEQRNDERRALRLSQLPARVMSAVKEHKFQIGQVVNFTPGALTLETSIGLYEVVRHLPPEGPENQYRVKSVLDSHERVVRESQIA
jgi:hypothetical protein